MFKHLGNSLLGYEDLSSVTSDSGSRKYVTPHGKEYPSITTVLSVLSRDSIEAWKKRVGYEKAKRISKKGV